MDDRLPSRQARIVFACLVDHHGHPISRRSLAEALWGDDPPAAHDVGLRSVLSGARRPLGPESVRGRAEVWLELPPDVWIDIEVAEGYLDRAEAAVERDRPEEAQGEAAAAGELLQDEFLPGCGGPWVEQRRTEIEERGRHARELEARAALVAGDAARAEHLARRLIERAPYRESAYAVLMEALAAQGNAAEALLTYDGLMRLLRDDLGAVPSPAVAALHEQLLAGGASGDGAVVLTRRKRRRPGRTIGVALAATGIALFVVGLVAGSGTDPPPARAEATGPLPTQEAVLPAKGVTFSYPRGWNLHGPVGGLAGVGDGEVFCNLYRVRGAAPPGSAPRGILGYARARLRAWQRRAATVSTEPVHALRAGRRLGASAVEHDHAFGRAGGGRVTFFKAGPDVLRVECGAPVRQFALLDRRAFRPMLHSLRTIGG